LEPRGRGRGAVTERPIILVVEDEYELQAILDEALTESGFAPEILSSAEEALTLFRDA